MFDIHERSSKTIPDILDPGKEATGDISSAPAPRMGEAARALGSGLLQRKIARRLAERHTAPVQLHEDPAAAAGGKSGPAEPAADTVAPADAAAPAAAGGEPDTDDAVKQPVDALIAEARQGAADPVAPAPAAAAPATAAPAAAAPAAAAPAEASAPAAPAGNAAVDDAAALLAGNLEAAQTAPAAAQAAPGAPAEAAQEAPAPSVAAPAQEAVPAPPAAQEAVPAPTAAQEAPAAAAAAPTEAPAAAQEAPAAAPAPTEAPAAAAPTEAPAAKAAPPAGGVAALHGAAAGLSKAVDDASHAPRPRPRRPRPPAAAPTPDAGAAALIGGNLDASHPAPAAPAHSAPTHQTPAAPAPAAPGADEDRFLGVRSVRETKTGQKLDPKTGQIVEDLHHDQGFEGYDIGSSQRIIASSGAASSAVFVAAQVETDGAYDNAQTYDSGVLSFGIMQWTLHQGSLVQFLSYLKNGAGPEAAAAFAQHFLAHQIDVVNGQFLFQGTAYHGPAQMHALVRKDLATSKRWALLFHQAGLDPRVQKAEFDYAVHQFKTLTASATEGNLDRHTSIPENLRDRGWAKSFTPTYQGHYGNASQWCSSNPKASALYFSMYTNNPTGAYIGILKAINKHYAKHGLDRSTWPPTWRTEFADTLEFVYANEMFANWKTTYNAKGQRLREGRTEKTMRLFHELQGQTGAAAPATTPRPAATPATTATPAPAATPATAPHPAHGHAPRRPAAPAAPAPVADSYFARLSQHVRAGLIGAERAIAYLLHPSRPSPGPARGAPPTPGPRPPARPGQPGNIFQTVYSGDGALSSDKLSQEASRELSEFKRKVYQHNVRRNLAAHREFFPGLPPAQLVGFGEGKHQLRPEAAGPASALLTAARLALKQAQEQGDPQARKVASIGVCSAYRDIHAEFDIWSGGFHRYFNEMRPELEALPGGPYCDAAVEKLGNYISIYKAVPGFSNHTAGRALDLQTTESGVTYAASKSQNAGWKKTWLRKWLEANASGFGWKPYDREMWHWQFEG